MTQPAPWWTTVPPHIERLARAICGRGTDPDTEVLPYQAAGIAAPNTFVTLAPRRDIVPLWTCYVALAQAALEVRDELDVSDLTTADQEAVLFTDAPDEKWRKEVGLDGEETV